jgi:hypothetical protein
VSFELKVNVVSLLSVPKVVLPTVFDPIVIVLPIRLAITPPSLSVPS